MRRVVALLLACSCATAPTVAPRVEPPPPAPPAEVGTGETSNDEWSPFPEPDSGGFIGHLVASRAAQLVGVRLSKAAPGLPDDCTGLVRAAWQVASLPLMAEAQAGDSGVAALWHYAQNHHALVVPCAACQGQPAIEPGVILFFRDTYDRNRDGRFNDGLTHVGIAERIDDDGTITYIHRGGSGVARARLNLQHPAERAVSGTLLNDYLRPPSKRSAPVLGSELFAGFARARLLTQ